MLAYLLAVQQVQVSTIIVFDCFGLLGYAITQVSHLPGTLGNELHHGNHFPVAALLGVVPVPLQGAVGLLLNVYANTFTSLFKRLELFFCI